MNKLQFAIATSLVYALFLIACNQNPDDKGNDANIEVVNDSTIPQPEWVNERVEKSRERAMVNDAGKLVWKSIMAHGGLKNWFEKGPLAFRFNYQPINGGKNRDTYQYIDTWSSRARHQVSAYHAFEFGWDGKNAWQINPDSNFKFNPRFWALTPFYFVGIPFVLADPGINYEMLDSIFYKNVMYPLVKISYEKGTGDAPDDYYILYVNPKTYIVDAIRYIVSYPGYFPDGGHSPEKFMSYESYNEFNGILISTEHHTSKWNEDGIGEMVTNIHVSSIEFKSELPAAFFEMPEGAEIVE